MNTEVTDYIQHAPAEQRKTMDRLRQLLHETVPGVKEEFKWGRPVFRTSRDFAYLKAAKSYVSLGFFQFKNLEDPAKLLEGTGKDMRHIKLKKVGDIDSQLLKKWFQTASNPD